MHEFWFNQKPEDLAGITDMERFSRDKMPYVEADATYDIKQAVTAVLSGPAVFIMDGGRRFFIDRYPNLPRARNRRAAKR